jgi:REP element-mobilizing transposase RayT
MARLPRYALPGQAQHIIQRGNNRQVIFASDADFQFFRDAVVTAAEQKGIMGSKRIMHEKNGVRHDKNNGVRHDDKNNGVRHD